MLTEYRRSDAIALLALLLVVAVLGLMTAYLVSRHGTQSAHGRLLFGAPSYAHIADEIIDHGRPGTPNEGLLDRMPVYIGLVVVCKLIGGLHWSYVLITVQGALAFLGGFMLNRT